MTRKEGFIEVDKMLQEIGVDTTSLSSILKNPQINVIKDDHSGLHFSFEYKNETYFYKCSIRFDGSVINPYYELVAEELAKDFGIPSIDYDLAILNSKRGVISKNFKQSCVNYILGDDILEKFIDYYDSDYDNDLVKKSMRTKNTLEIIWDKLESRYQNYPNKRKLITNLMKKIVDIYLFDIITNQMDRHSGNWQIMESNNGIDIAPLYDNERILARSEDQVIVCLGVNYTRGDYEYLWGSIRRFQKVSSSEFTDIIKDKLWIISEENLHKVFERIEKKTGYPMPEEEKEYYLSSYRGHKKRLEEVLGLALEREEHNEGKNR